MALASITVLTSVVCVCRTGAASETSTVARDLADGERDIDLRRLVQFQRQRRMRSAVWKPVASTRTS